MFSKPLTWDFSFLRIAKDHSDGKEAVRTGLVELEKAGYLRREKQVDGKTIYILTHEPSSDNQTEVIKEPSSDFPNLAKSQVPIIGTISKTDTTQSNTEVKEKHIPHSGNDVGELVHFFFEKKGWAYTKDKASIFRRFLRTAKDIISIASLEEAKDKVSKVAKWADERDLDWTLDTVIKKWMDIDHLATQEKKKKAYIEGDRAYEKNGEWFIINRSGEHVRYVGSRSAIYYE